MRQAASLLPLALLAAGCTATGAGGASSTSTVVGSPVQGAVTTLSVAQLAPLVQSGEIVLIDVRTPEEFAQGNIPGAVNMPVGAFDPQALPDPDDAEVILYCRSSARSGRAAQQYVNETGLSIRHLDGGILAWEAAGEAIEAVEQAPLQKAPSQSD